jgi:2-dehydro-3-deoxygluconokinase
MRIVCVGEAMLELSCAHGAWQLGYGGDTLNTALHLARFGCDVAFFSALGGDGLSAALPKQWAAEGLDCRLLLRDEKRSTGLYAISTNDAGERSFSYWRSDSAARQMFDLAESEAMLAQVAQADVLVYSLITLAILSQQARVQLYALCRAIRARGGRVVFDGNYRPKLWDSPHEALQARDAALACADIGLPTLEDETLMGGATSAEAVAVHWAAQGCGEVIVKLGAQGCRLPDGEIIAPAQVLHPVDTSGAGDSFNAGYLAARLRGAGMSEAAAAGHKLAGWVVMRSGAIPHKDAAAPY